jgi:hypothetical protein
MSQTHRSDAMLSGARLGDDALLAHALAQQHLAQRVVDLVRARVIQVLALQIDLASPTVRPDRDAARRIKDTSPDCPLACPWPAKECGVKSLRRASKQ